jgi:hypothetical protein
MRLVSGTTSHMVSKQSSCSEKVFCVRWRLRSPRGRTPAGTTLWYASTKERRRLRRRQMAGTPLASAACSAACLSLWFIAAKRSRVYRRVQGGRDRRRRQCIQPLTSLLRDVVSDSVVAGHMALSSGAAPP